VTSIPAVRIVIIKLHFKSWIAKAQKEN